MLVVTRASCTICCGRTSGGPSDFRASPKAGAMALAGGLVLGLVPPGPLRVLSWPSKACTMGSRNARVRAPLAQQEGSRRAWGCPKSTLDEAAYSPPPRSGPCPSSPSAGQPRPSGPRCPRPRRDAGAQPAALAVSSSRVSRAHELAGRTAASPRLRVDVGAPSWRARVEADVHDPAARRAWRKPWRRRAARRPGARVAGAADPKVRILCTPAGRRRKDSPPLRLRVLSARHGHRTLVISTDAAHSLADAACPGERRPARSRRTSTP
jgi:hypothetical protein